MNQDYMLTREDSATKTLVLGAFDGHGEHGHCISEVHACIDKWLVYLYQLL